MKHKWIVDKADHMYYLCEECGFRRTFNPNIDYTGGSVPWPLTGYENMELNESLYGDCHSK